MIRNPNKRRRKHCNQTKKTDRNTGLTLERMM